MKYFIRFTIGLLLFLLISFSSCSKSKNNLLLKNDVKDSAGYYYNRSKLKGVSNNEKTKNLKKAVVLISKKENTLQNRNLLNKIIVDFVSLKSIENVNQTSSLLLIRSKEAKDFINLGMSYRGKANYFYKKQILDSSFYYYIKAEKIYNKLHDKVNYPNVLLNKGIIQCEIGDYLGAEFSLNKSYLLFKKLGDYNKMYGCLVQLGLVSTELKDYDKGIFFYKKALDAISKLTSEKDKRHFRTVCNNNIGYLYLKSNNFDKAKFYFIEALKSKSIEHEDPLLYSNLIDNLGYCKLQTNDLKDLPNLFFEALKIRIKLHKDPAIIASYINLSEYYNVINKKDLSLKYSQMALKIAKESKSSLDITASLRQAAIVDRKNASKYTTDYIRINDSIQLAERKSKDRFARIQLETNEITQEKETAVKQKWVLASVIATVLVIVILLFIIYRQKSNKRELQLLNEQQKNNEITYQLLLHQQDKEEAARQTEKKRIALELHDGIMNQLASTRLNLSVLSNTNDPAVIANLLKHVENIRNIETEIRNIAHDLNKDVFNDINSFIVALQNFIIEQNNNSKTQYKLELDEKINWEQVSSEIKMHLYRIIQEATQNTNKYAQATKGIIGIIQDENNICMSISDNGIGFDQTKIKEGMGIKNMMQRIKVIKGLLSISSTIGKGTYINCSVPIVKGL